MKVEKEYLVDQKYRIHGFNDDVCNCDVCGKTELKGTYAMENLQTGEIFRAGSTCGAKMAGWTTKQLVAIYTAGEKEKLESAKREFRESAEYKAMDRAYDFLQKELDVVKRTLRNRLEYLKPFSEALEIKRNELKLKYNLSEKTYLN